MLCRITWQFSGCSACWFVLGINDVPVRQAEIARGSLIVLPWNLRKIPLGVYWTRLAATSRAGPILWRQDPVPTVPFVLGLSCQGLLLACSKDSKKLCKYIHTPITIHHLRYQHPSEGCNVPLHMWVYTCPYVCYPHKWTTAFLSIWVLQGDAIKVFPLTTCTVCGEKGGFSLG